MRDLVEAVRGLLVPRLAATLMAGALSIFGLALDARSDLALTPKIEALTSEIADLEAQIAALQAANSSEWEQITLLRLEIADLKQQLRDLENKPASVQPAPDPKPDGGNRGWPEDVIPTRVFSGPEQYPPTAFRAYGIVAFANHPNGPERERAEAICDAYLNTLNHTSDLPDVAKKDQMVTVWPLITDDVADTLNGAAQGEGCQDAIGDYSLITAKRAIKTARNAGLKVSGRGPFLLAWAPGDAYAGTGKPVLMADLSLVETFPEARSWFLKWQDDIEQNPEVWNDGFDLAAFRLMGRNWLDRTGKQILEVLGP